MDEVIFCEDKMIRSEKNIFKVNDINELACEKSALNSEKNFSNTEDVFISKSELIIDSEDRSDFISDELSLPMI